MLRGAIESSALLKLVTFFPDTRGRPSAPLTLRNTPGAWHTTASGLFAPTVALIKAME